MPSRSLPSFTPRALLDLGTIPAVEYLQTEVIFSPGDASRSVMYIQRGGVKLSVLSKSGREAVVAVLGPGDFLGEECLAGERTRIRSATAIARSTIFVVAKDTMVRLLGKRHVSEGLLSHVLVRHSSMEQDLVDQLFRSTEKELARTLLVRAQYGTRDAPQRVVRRVSNQTLANIVGTTRSRIAALMDKFQRAGFIAYDGGLVINPSLVSVVLHD